MRVDLLEGEPPDSLRPAWCAGSATSRSPSPIRACTRRCPEELVEIPLLEDQLTVLLPTGHPLARRRAVQLAELSEERWIAGCLRCRANFLHECAEQGFAPDIAFTTDDNLVVQSLVAAGLGVAMMPALVLSFLCHRKVTGRALRTGVAAPCLRVRAARASGDPGDGAWCWTELKTVAGNRVGC